MYVDVIASSNRTEIKKIMGLSNTHGNGFEVISGQVKKTSIDDLLELADLVISQSDEPRNAISATLSHPHYAKELARFNAQYKIMASKEPIDGYPRLWQHPTGKMSKNSAAIYTHVALGNSGGTYLIQFLDGLSSRHYHKETKERWTSLQGELTIEHQSVYNGEACNQVLCTNKSSSNKLTQRFESFELGHNNAHQVEGKKSIALLYMECADRERMLDDALWDHHRMDTLIGGINEVRNHAQSLWPKPRN